MAARYAVDNWHCPDCRRNAPRCALHEDVDHHDDARAAYARGHAWATRVAAAVGLERAWPRNDKAAAIARRLVANLTTNPARHARLAAICEWRAREHFAWLRQVAEGKRPKR